MNKHAGDFDKLIKAYMGLKPRLMQKAATMTVTFFKENFRRQGFLDRSLQPWDKRVPGTPRDAGRAIEFNKGTLRRGVKKKKVSNWQAIVGVDSSIKYAEIQNNGGQVPITRKMRRYFWAMYYANANQITFDRRTKKAANNQRNQRLNEVAQFWKNLALTQKTHITIPKRQFIGDSVTNETQLKEMFTQELDLLFSQI